MDKPYKTRWWAIFDPAAIVADPLLQDNVLHVLAMLMINIVILFLITLSNIRKGFDNMSKLSSVMYKLEHGLGVQNRLYSWTRIC